MSDNTTENDGTPSPPRGIGAVQQHVMANKVEAALWVSRILSIVLAIGYLIPIFGYVLFKISIMTLINVCLFFIVF